MSTDPTESTSSDSTASTDTTETVTGPQQVSAALDALKTIGNQYPSIQDTCQAERFALDITDEHVEVLFRWLFPADECTELEVAQKTVDVSESMPTDSGIETDYQRSTQPDLIQLDVRVRHPIETDTGSTSGGSGSG